MGIFCTFWHVQFKTFSASSPDSLLLSAAIFFGLLVLTFAGPPEYGQALFRCVHMLVNGLQFLNDLLAGCVLHSRSACVPATLRLLIFHLLTSCLNSHTQGYRILLNLNRAGRPGRRPSRLTSTNVDFASHPATRPFTDESS